MKLKASAIKIFKIKNRKGFAAICRSHLTEGRTAHQAYERMLKALKRSKMEVTGKVINLSSLVRAVV